MPEARWRPRLFSYGPAILWAGLIFWSSSLPVPPVLEGLPAGSDKVAHLIEYGILSYLLTRALRGTSPGRHPGRMAVVVVLITSLYGAFDEFHQSFVPFRTVDPLDVLADAAGAALVQLFLVLGQRV